MYVLQSDGFTSRLRLSKQRFCPSVKMEYHNWAVDEYRSVWPAIMALLSICIYGALPSQVKHLVVTYSYQRSREACIVLSVTRSRFKLLNARLPQTADGESIKKVNFRRWLVVDHWRRQRGKLPSLSSLIVDVKTIITEERPTTTTKWPFMYVPNFNRASTFDEDLLCLRHR